MLDRAAIEECLLRYTRGIDRHDVELVHVRVPSGRAGHPRHVRGRPARRRRVGQRAARPALGRHQHYITNTTVDIDGDVAHTDTYYLIVLRRNDGTGQDLMGGRYVDRFERRAGDWRIARRVVTHEWIGEIDAGRPTMQSLLDLYVEARWDRDDISYQRPLTGRVDADRADDDFQQSAATTS